MRQRVGFARAIVTDPEVLLMDEPFSALDVLTAENLRGELLEIWERTDISIQAIVIVTQNIEEAVLLADRIVVLGSNPGRIQASLEVALPRPRDRKTLEFEVLVNQLYRIMTGRDVRAQAPAGGPNGAPDTRRNTCHRAVTTGLGRRAVWTGRDPCRRGSLHRCRGGGRPGP